MRMACTRIDELIDVIGRFAGCAIAGRYAAQRGAMRRALVCRMTGTAVIVGMHALWWIAWRRVHMHCSSFF